MDTVRADRAFEKLDRAIAAERARLARSGPSERAGAYATELDRLFLEEIDASAALCGAALKQEEVAALVTFGVALGGHRLDAYVSVADYAAALGFVREAPLPGRRRPFLRLDEIVELHALATARRPAARPGVWRSENAAALSGGVVPPPPWLIPREAAAFAARIGPGPLATESPVFWAAAALARLHRIHPFTAGNGRTARLVANLLLRRTGHPPFLVRRSAVHRYAAALERAEAGDPWPLAHIVAGSVLSGLTRIVTAVEGSEGALLPLAAFAGASDRAALYKAAQRGTLRSIRRGAALLTSAAWVASYQASRKAPP